MTETPSLIRRLIPFLIALLILASAGAGFYWLLKTRSQAADRPISEKTWKVSAIEARFQTIAPTLTLYGRLESPLSSELTAAVNAFVDRRLVDEGDRVRKEELLIQLDPRDARLNVEQRQGQLADIEAKIQAELTRYRSDLKALAIEQELLTLAERAVARFKELKGRNVGTDTQLDEARRTYQQQALSLNNRRLNINDHQNRLAQLKAQQTQIQAQLESARLDLQRTTIEAPYDGRIATISVAPGDRVRTGDPILHLYADQVMEVRSQLPSRILPKIRRALNQGLKLTASAILDGSPLEMELDRLSGEVGNGQAGVDALLKITSPRQDLELGRTLELKLQLPPEDHLLVLPPQALYGTNRVYLVQDNRLQGVAIRRVGDIVIDGEHRILVSSDQIQSGQQIVTTQLPNAITGLKVEVIEHAS